MTNINQILNSLENYVPFALVVACIASLRFIDQGAVVILIFSFALIVYFLKKYDSRILMGFALLLLIFTAATRAIGSESYADQIAVWAYYFLVIGVILSLTEYLRSGDEDDKEDRKSY